MYEFFMKYPTIQNYFLHVWIKLTPQTKFNILSKPFSNSTNHQLNFILKSNFSEIKLITNFVTTEVTNEKSVPIAYDLAIGTANKLVVTVLIRKVQSTKKLDVKFVFWCQSVNSLMESTLVFSASSIFCHHD